MGQSSLCPLGLGPGEGPAGGSHGAERADQGSQVGSLATQACCCHWWWLPLSLDSSRSCNCKSALRYKRRDWGAWGGLLESQWKSHCSYQRKRDGVLLMITKISQYFHSNILQVICKMENKTTKESRADEDELDLEPSREDTT